MTYSPDLPGREGAFVYPYLVSLIPVKTEKGIIFQLGYTQTVKNRALCFGCVEEKLPENKKEFLKKVYEAVTAEDNYEEINRSISPGIIPLEVMKQAHDAENKLSDLVEALSEECIFCGDNVQNGKPYFSATAINRILSRKNIGSFGAYDETENGLPYFNICFEDFVKYFPINFESLSLDLREITVTSNNFNDVIIDPGFEKWIEESGGSIDEFIDSLKGNKLRIIRKIDPDKPPKP